MIIRNIYNEILRVVLGLGLLIINIIIKNEMYKIGIILFIYFLIKLIKSLKIDRTFRL